MSARIPATYAEWRHCIEADCGIPLTPDFIAARLAVWRSPESHETQRFAALYGHEHLNRVVGWFDDALAASVAIA